MLNIGQNRECFFDTTLIDTDKTTAQMHVHEPILRDTVMIHDAPWEGSGSNYHNGFFDDSWPGVDGSHPKGMYRMYYLGWQGVTGNPSDPPFHDITVCYAESPDGLNWTKPFLGLHAWKDCKDTNIILKKDGEWDFDNFMVFRDDNPACPPEKKYKAAARHAAGGHRALYAYYSADGIRFTRGGIITDQGYFDSLNVVFWDERAKLYRGYIRGFHNVPDNQLNKGIRDIRYIESADFETWSDPVLLNFQGGEDYPLYTNNVMPYCRAPQLLIGLPTRYVERPGWTGNFDELCGREKRLQRMSIEPRYGLTVTDCVFMCSRDGHTFHRFEDAFMRPAPENGMNWLYGDCYPARCLIETPSAVPGAANELSLYLTANHFTAVPALLQRYTIRLDGFASLYAGGSREEVLVTKPFIFDGGELYANLSTSARGYMFFTLRCGSEEITSCETFGNAVDRRIVFDKGAVGDFSGKEVILTIRMKDADLYAIRFGE